MQYISAVQAAQQVDNLFLRGGTPGTELRARGIPDVLQHAGAVHQAYQVPGGGREPKMARGNFILEHVPQFTPVVAWFHHRMAAQSGLELRYAVPGWTLIV